MGGGRRRCGARVVRCGAGAAAAAARARARRACRRVAAAAPRLPPPPPQPPPPGAAEPAPPARPPAWEGAPLPGPLLARGRPYPPTPQGAGAHAPPLHAPIKTRQDGWLLDRGTMERYLTAAEAEYNANPYHNNIHAADVAQTSAVIMRAADAHLRRAGGGESDSGGGDEAADSGAAGSSGGGEDRGPSGRGLTRLERFSVIFASAVHDLGHPGLNNDFLVRTRDRQAIIYNDKSAAWGSRGGAARGLRGPWGLGGWAPGRQARAAAGRAPGARANPARQAPEPRPLNLSLPNPNQVGQREHALRARV
jgi:hypothetical protein